MDKTYWLKHAMLALFVIALIATLAASTYVQNSLPQLNGRVSAEGLRAEVHIERDADGIPTIKAHSPQDALFGLGYVHAQDRLWQLEMHRRTASGRLAEVFGEAALETDKFLRALGARRAAAAQWKNASPEVKQTIQAYAAGINAYINSDLLARPPEFVLLGLHPEPWQPEDVLAWATMMAWDLGGNWSAELLRMRLSLTLPVSRINELLPPYAGEKPLATTDYAALFRGLRIQGDLGKQALLAAPESGIEGVGSNNWVISGKHTESGQPLLANDPHLKLSAPALWYLVRLDAPGLRVAGASVPGLSAVVIGQTDHLAWGFTNTGPDVQDLYLERIKPDDPTQYQTPTGWESFQVFEETIRVKGQPDVMLTTRQSRHGPVISDANAAPTQGLLGPASEPEFALALRWTALDIDAWKTIAAASGFAKATTVAEFVDAAAQYVAPMQNIVVADRGGHIGMVSAGRVPLRKPENDLKGLVPSPGWDARYDWDGSLAPELTPRELDPPRGWIATANQRVHATDYPYFITSEWSPPYRHQRIESLLAAQDKHSIESMARIQADIHSLGTQRLIPFLRQAAAASKHPLATAAQAELAGFDGDMQATKAAPLIAWAWARQLTEALFSDKMGAQLYSKQLVGSRSFREGLQYVLENSVQFWCDNQTTAAVEHCDDQMAAAFDRTMDELQTKQGPTPAKWQWGRAHQARAEHRPFSKVRALSPFFELRAPTGGDTYTVNQTRVTLKPDATTGELYLNEHGASYRGLYDLAHPEKSTFIQSTGQSGNPFSPWYRSMTERWGAVKAVPIFGSEKFRTLVLRPHSP
jgi:penicillin amidase